MVEQLVIFLCIGLIGIISGLIMLFNPQILVKWGEFLNRVLVRDESFYRKRNIIGVFLVLAGLYLLYKVYLMFFDQIL